MRIGIDIRSLQNDSRNRGIGMYTRCLIKNILSMDKRNEYVLFVYKGQPLPQLLKEGPFNFTKRIKISEITSHKKYLGWISGQIFFPQAIAREKLDLFHSTEYILPAFSRSKKIITVHDFIHSDYEIYRRRNNTIRKIYLRLRNVTLKCADQIIADSEYTKSKIIQLLGLPRKEVRVIYLGADPIFAPREGEDLCRDTKEKYGIRDDFLLYVGVTDQHKNIHGLIKAFSSMRLKEIELVLAGAVTDTRYFTFIHSLIEELALEDRVHVLGYIPQEDLANLYNAANIVISVSFYEGFGLPILEAMACARPVIAASNTSMKEVVSDAGLLVDPYNIEDIASAMDRLFSDDELRKSLSAKALARSKEFSWEKTAREILSLYGELLN